ncbi:tetratricopeptide repeat protein [uncultured Oscillibacter sp.]|uniref:tetratricopeptide repeat protein n=1 Tax=uncultured Oscillibacter sp. TaxID=876091 RepID=UPI0025FBAC53|nr:hypothetical protein [uncultured Oscillibacter sp.]
MALSSEVKQALQDIYYNERTGRGKEAFALLERASANGDGDASCVLARCLCGYQYVWRGHGFPEDDDRATQLLHKSVEQGSALGVLVALRSGELTPSVQKKMPFESLQQAFDQAEELAKDGDAFSQYVVGNSYFWWDFLRIQNKGRDSFPSQAEFKAYLMENISKCEDWFWKAFRGGVYFAANNLNQYYTKGDEDIIAPQPEKAKDLWKIGAEYGHPIHQSIYADELKKAEQYEEALHWHTQAAEGGNPGDWYEVGELYFAGKGVEKDAARAVSFYEKELARDPGHTGANNMLGKAYFLGEGVQQDYAKAFHHLSFAYYERQNKWGVFYLAKCCFYGLGTPQDYGRALQFLKEVDWANREADYMRGCIYARGLGVPEDIKKGVEYLQKAGNFDKAKEELLHYKKTLFGKWIRR